MTSATGPAPDLSFRDPSLPVAERVERLLAQMTLEEKAGLFFHTMIAPGPNPAETYHRKTPDWATNGSKAAGALL